MKQTVIRLGFCPTRRDVFSREDAIRYARLVRDEVSKHNVTVTDLYGINEEGLLFDRADVPKVIRLFREAEVDALFLPHCNFGSEQLVSEVARALNVPVLLWGPRDDAPEANGMRQRDSQCGLFATGKVLRRHNVPFTYLTNSWYDSQEFHDGFQRFLAVANVVRAVRGLHILQISTRPEPFASVICNENELLERFDIHVIPIALPTLTAEMDRLRAENGPAMRETAEWIRTHVSPDAPQTNIDAMASLKLAIRKLAEQYRCKAGAIQCWDALQDVTGIMPCLANAMLADEGMPVACETDIHGAISAVMAQAATLDEKPHFLADVTVRHPERENVELLWHCGVFPYSLAKDKETARAGAHWILPSGAYGTCMWELEPGELTIVRFDGDHGDYRLLIGEAVTTDGPATGGSYVWIQVGNWPMWEHKLVRGPYIHHVAAVYGRYGEILAEACRYLNGLTPDPTEPSLAELESRWM